jgi:hypothetical protein
MATVPVRLWPCESSLGVLGALELGESVTEGTLGRSKADPLLSDGRGDGLEEPVRSKRAMI